MRDECRLSIGDSVYVIAPGMPFSRSDLLSGVRLLKSWGLEVIGAERLTGKDLICASSQPQRAEQLVAALRSQAKVIWCVRGGYGSVHLLPMLQKLKRPSGRKLLVGFSDITSLHLHVNQNWQWPSLHAPHVNGLAELSSVRQKELYEILFGGKKDLEYKLKPLNLPAQERKKIEAPLVGGNLITLQSLFATPWQLQTKGRILFFEDIGERAYKLDRVFEQMKLMGLWKQVRAIVCGHFTGGAEPGTRTSKVPRLFRQFAAGMKVPVYSGLNVGHVPQSRPLPLNTKAVIANHQLRVRVEL